MLNLGAGVDSFMQENLHSLSVASLSGGLESAAGPPGRWRLGHELLRCIRIQLLRCGSYHHGWMSSSAMRIERRPLRKYCGCLDKAIVSCELATAQMGMEDIAPTTWKS